MFDFLLAIRLFHVVFQLSGVRVYRRLFSPSPKFVSIFGGTVDDDNPMARHE